MVSGRLADRLPVNAPREGRAAEHRGELMLAAPTLIQAGYGEREGQAPRALDLQQPVGTVVAGGIKHAIATAIMVQAGHGEGQPGRAQRWGHGSADARTPAGTITASGGGQSTAVAYMMQANGGFNETPGHDLRGAASTITNTGSQQQLVVAHLVTNTSGHAPGGLRDAAPTITAGAEHHGLVEYRIAPEDEAGALQVAAFLMRYYGQGGQWGDLREPAATLTTKDRLALVTVFVRGTPYVVVDIHLRMLTPRELYRLQGFPDDYIIDRGHDGRAFTKSQQVHMVGNSVSPPPAVALIAANAPQELQLLRRVA